MLVKVIILAGGLGTRISEETENKPKPMISLNGRPILWHLMNIFWNQGFNDFVIAGGYKAEVIQNWLNSTKMPWDVSLIDTGLETQTAGRIRMCLSEFEPQRAIVTYGDGLGNINLNKLLNFHKDHGKIATVTSVRPPSRFGVIESENGLVTHFGEKLQTDAGWINGGFFVLNKKIMNYLSTDETCDLEFGALQHLSKAGELQAFIHNDFWQCMDNVRERDYLDGLVKKGQAPWIKWK
jgi:glucose-1-phosphate cytidylyltransferase